MKVKKCIIHKILIKLPSKDCDITLWAFSTSEMELDFMVPEATFLGDDVSGATLLCDTSSKGGGARVAKGINNISGISFLLHLVPNLIKQ